MAYRSLGNFNAEARFVANRAFCHNGRKFPREAPADGIPERRLRQLFEMRIVRPLEETEQPAAAPAPARKRKK